MKQIFDKYKVLITACIMAIVISVQQFAGQDDISWKAIGLAAVLAIVGAIGNYLRGQYVSMAGIIGVATMAITEIANGGVISWQQLAISFTVAFGAMLAPPPKPRSYENDPTIKEAKTKL